MVLEPLNPWRDHPGLFLTRMPQAFQICSAVGSPFCKILDDLYHQQITEGNLIPNIDRSWSEIAYFQIGDNPGRKEPGTGEINYKNVFTHIHAKGFTGIMGMEHGNSQPGKEERARGDRRLSGLRRLDSMGGAVSRRPLHPILSSLRRARAVSSRVLIRAGSATPRDAFEGALLRRS